MRNFQEIRAAFQALQKKQITRDQYNAVCRGEPFEPQPAPTAEPAATSDVHEIATQFGGVVVGPVSVVQSGHEAVLHVQKEPAAVEGPKLPFLPRGTSAGLAQDAPTDRGAKDQGQGEGIRERLPAARQAQAEAVPGLRGQSPNAPPELRQAVEGGLAVPKAPPAGAWTPQTLTWTDEQKRYAVWLVNTTRIGNRGEFDGTPEQQVAGKLGEVIVADALKLPRPEPVQGHDGGVDFTVFGQRVDLKTLVRTVWPSPEYQHNIPAPQIGNALLKPDVYLFGELNKKARNYHLVGWCWAKDFTTIATLHAKGTTKTRRDGTKLTFPVETWEVDCTAFNPWRGFDAFASAMSKC